MKDFNSEIGSDGLRQTIPAQDTLPLNRPYDLTRLRDQWWCNRKQVTKSFEIVDWLIGLVGRVFANGPGDLRSILGRVIPQTLKMVLDTSLFNTQQYKVRIKSKVEQSRERSSTLSLHLGVVAIEKGAFWSTSTTVANFTFYFLIV